MLSAGMGRRMGPMDLMHIKSPQQDSGTLLRSTELSDQNDEEHYYHATDMSTEQARWRNVLRSVSTENCFAASIAAD